MPYESPEQRVDNALITLLTAPTWEKTKDVHKDKFTLLHTTEAQVRIRRIESELKAAENPSAVRQVKPYKDLVDVSYKFGASSAWMTFEGSHILHKPERRDILKSLDAFMMAKALEEKSSVLLRYLTFLTSDLSIAILNNLVRWRINTFRLGYNPPTISDETLPVIKEFLYVTNPWGGMEVAKVKKIMDSFIRARSTYNPPNLSDVNACLMLLKDYEVE